MNYAAIVNKVPQFIISLIFLLGYFYNLNLFVTGQTSIPEGYDDYVKILLGLLTIGVPLVLQFWLGSSSGSKDKQIS